MEDRRLDNKGRLLRTGEGQDGDGRYYYRYTDTTGKRKTVYSWRLVKSDRLPAGKRACEPLRDVEKVIAKDLIVGRTSIGASRPTVNELFDKYMSTQKNLKEQTVTNRVMSYNKHIRDGFGRMRIDEVKYSHVKNLYQTMHYDEDLAIATITNINAFIEPVFKMAVRDGYIDKNPVEGVLLELRRASHDQREMRHGLTLPQQHRYLDYLAQNDRYLYRISVFLIGTGVRIGEAAGLRWIDCDFENSMIRIDHSIEYYKKRDENGKRFHLSTPKTKSGVRTIPMFDEVKAVLREQYEYCKVCGFSECVVDGISGFVFSSINDLPLSSTSIGCRMKSVVKRCNAVEEKIAEAECREPILVPHVSPHTLRHTFCMRICENENNLKLIQDVMGHSDITTTMNVYNEITQEKKELSFKHLNGKMGLS